MAITMEELKRKAKSYDDVREKIALRFGSNVAEEIFSEFEMNEDERIRNEIISYLHNEKKVKRYISDIEFDKWIDWLEKQGEWKSQGKSALESWKDMRLEVYQQASGNRHEPNYSDDATKMFSLNDIDEIFEKIAEKKELKKLSQQEVTKISDQVKGSDWSEEDEKMLDDAIGAVGAADYYTYDDKQEIENWLKSLKQRIGG